jgi:hypothetical protein
MSGLGRRFVRLARAVTAVAFSAIAIWLFETPALAGSLAAGWMFASLAFPRAQPTTNERDSLVPQAVIS